MDGHQPADQDLAPEEAFIFDQEILDAFVNEAKEHLENIEQDFLALESQSPNPDPNLIDKVFRAIHSIKGSAGFMQFKKIAELSHVMEALLQKMRSREIRPESPYIDALLTGCDLLNRMIGNVRESENTDIQEAHGRLSALLVDKAADPDTPKLVPDTPKLVPDTPKLVPDTPTPLPDTPTPLPDTPTPIPDTPTPLLDAKESVEPPETSADESDHEKDRLFDQEMLEIFVAESKEHLEHIEEDFLILESQASDPDPNLIDKLFRAVHSIKGSAGMLELGKISKLSHAMETLLQKIRSREIQPESEYIEALLEGCDLLNRMVANVGESEETDIDAVHGRVSALLDHSAPRIEPEPAPTNPVPQAHGDHSETVRIKVDLLNLLMTLAGELVLVRNQHLLTVNELDPELRGISQRMDMVTTQLQETIMRTRMQPVGNLFSKLPRIVRDISRKMGKQILLHTIGDEVELDKTILESLSDPLTHIIRNACDHGIEIPEERHEQGKPESGTITVRAFHEAGQIHIVIQDDGSGIDSEVIKEEALKRGLKTRQELNRMGERDILSLIMMPGFSTSERTTEISGRGVGMDVVKSSVEQQGGSVEMNSEKGEGTTIHLRLPLTLAIIPCLIVEVGKERYAIPKVSVDELVCLYDEEVFAGIEYAGGQEIYRLRDTLLPIVRMAETLSRPGKFTEETRSKITETHSRIAKAAMEGGERIRQALLFAVVKIGTQRFGLVVDRVMGSEEIVVNPIHPRLKSLSIYSGTTIMGDGAVALILDIHGIAGHTGVEFISEPEKAVKKGVSSENADVQRVLIFKNGVHERFAVPLAMIRRVQDFSASRIESVGSREYITIDGISTLILRLDRLLNVSPCVEAAEEMYLLMPRHTSRPFGILISRVKDVVTVPLTLNEESHVEDGILGTAIVSDRMTLFPDIYRLLEKADSGRREDVSDVSTTSDVGRRRILLVEDAAFFRRLVKGYLTSQFTVEAAVNGLEALELMETGDFDLIVSDIEMPEMDGWAFLKQVRSSERYRDVPAVALTTLDSPEDRVRMMRVGFNAYEKKIDRERLLNTVNRLLQGDATVRRKL